MHSSPATVSICEGQRLVADRPLSVAAAGYWRGGLVLCVLAAGMIAYAVGDPNAVVQVDPGLARLLRGMAVLKAMMVLPVFAALYWRFGLPVSTGVAVGYIAGVSVMTAGAALIWQLSFIGPTAFCFHLALVGLLLFARKDDCGPALRAALRSASVRG